MVARFEKFSYLISELSKLLHKLEAEVLEPLGLKGPHAIYILTIAKYKDGITASELSKACSRDKADVSRAISALVSSGLAEKSIRENAKYKAEISLTEEGYKVAKSLSETAKNAVEFASRGVSDCDRSVFYETLEAIFNNMKRMSELGVPSDAD
ncbi:MAG: hypothetical protein IJY23_01680 [Clostridia bacterium]|nr:hypothetical protein [Clostridia bacterium]